MLRHIGRFAFVGVINTAVYYGIYLLLNLFAPYLVAHLVAIVVAMVGSFFMNCYWTFETAPTWRKFLIFPLTNATNYVSTTAGVVILVEWAGVDERIAPLIAAVAAIPITFLLSRQVLRGGQDSRPAAEAVRSDEMENRLT